MGSRIRYAVGLCLQVVGLLNFVFLVGVPIWWFGRRLCRDARTDERSPSHADRARATRASTIGHSGDGDRDSDSRSAATTDSRTRHRAPLRRN